MMKTYEHNMIPAKGTDDCIPRYRAWQLIYLFRMISGSPIQKPFPQERNEVNETTNSIIDVANSLSIEKSNLFCLYLILK